MAILPLQLARVSNTLRTTVASNALTRTQADLLKSENELSTGKKLNSPSDDPGAAAVAQQLRKTLEQRLAYSDNLKQAGSQLGQVDSSLGTLSDLLNQAQTLASANVGSDVTPDARKAASKIVQSIYDQAISIGNTQLNGSYLFGGDRATDPPFVEATGGVKFVGSERTLENQYDDNSRLAFQVDGSAVFGALSSRVKGTVDLSPALSAATRLSDLGGGMGEGVHLGTVKISDGTASKVVDLSGADTIGDVINTINGAAVGAVVASIAPDGVSLQLAAGATDNVSVDDVAGGQTAADLGILNKAGAGVGTALDGNNVNATVTPLTTLASLRNGAGIDLTGFTIVNGQKSATIDLTGAVTVEDLLNRINHSGTNVRAEINATGTGMNLLNPTQGTQLRIAENGGTTVSDLGVRSFLPTTPLSELNEGHGVQTAAGNDIALSDSNGVAFQVDLTGAVTVQDVIDSINTSAGAASAGITASFATTGNGIVITDTAGGSQPLSLSAINDSNAAKDLGLLTPASGNVINGADVDQVAASGIFANLAKLRDALDTSDTSAITEAAGGLQTDYQRVVTIRGETGARVQDMETRQATLDDQNVATQSLLSQTEDVDYTQAIAKFQTLQTALQATLQTARTVMNLSLMDFLG